MFHFKFKRPSKFHLCLWILELTLLAGVVEYWLIRSRSASPEQKREISESSKRSLGRLLPLLGEQARVLPGLREVNPSHLAYLSGLADGSVAASETQLMVSDALKLPIELENRVGMVFRLVPPGTFLMGTEESEAGHWEGEVQHVAFVAATFYMGKFEVTQAQWNALMPLDPSYFKGGNRPVEEVTWYDCQKFMLALCEREGLPPGTYRLPTEVEWEYACRAGTTSAFCFGDDPVRLGEYADFADNNYRSTAVVGQRLPNAYGLYDMHGNVWEWCLNRFQDYDGYDEKSAGEGNPRVLRGGNWRDPAQNCRSANRCRLPPLSHGNMLGFRVVRALPEVQKNETSQKLQKRPKPADPAGRSKEDRSASGQ